MLMGGAVLLASSCTKGDETGAVTSKSGGKTSTAPASEASEHRDKAQVRVINASPADQELTIWAGDSAAFGNVAYRQATPYREIADDMFDFQMKPTRDAEALAHNRENLHDGGHYTIVALPDQGGPEKRNLRVLDDELKPVSADKARIRFVNGVPSDTDVDLLIAGREQPLFDGVNFKSEAGWDEIDPVAGTLQARPDDGKTVLASLANVKLEGGRSYTFVLTGRAGTYSLIRIEDDVAKSAT
jgi:hypothetical protein